MTSMQSNSAKAPHVQLAMERFLDDVGWGALLIVVGTLWLLPSRHLPHGTWMIAAGIILLALNLARCILRIQMSACTLIAGTVALLAGLGAAFGVELPIVPIALVVIGVCLLLEWMVGKDQRTPDAEHRSCC